MKKVTTITYMCSWCGAMTTRTPLAGRPKPGECPRKPKGRDGQTRPHTWVIARKN